MRHVEPHRARASLIGFVVAALVAALAGPAASQSQLCVGDCGGDGAVTVDELVRGVGIALGQRALDDCPPFDRDGNGQVAVNELVLGVTSALSGCVSVLPTDTATTALTPTPTVTATATESGTPAATPTPTIPPRPNFIIVNLDDTRFDGIDRMPVLQSRLVGPGVTFSESFVPNAVCCPSRASILSGLYSIHHGTRTVSGIIGGADTFRESGQDQQTIAVWLHDAGYTTGLFGKYLNDYGASESDKGPGGTFYIPPGWDRWRAFEGAEAYGGVSGQTYRIVDETRTVTVYDEHSSDAQYATDVLGGWVRDFVADAVAESTPFLVYFAPYASHGDPVDPAAAVRHFGEFDDLPPLRLPSWNEAEISDKPRWVGMLPPDVFDGFTDAVRRRAYESLLAVDEQLAALLDQLEELGVADHTLVLLTSDNGVGWGEHRLFVQTKEAPYEECVRVPMMARYPRGPVGPRNVEAAVLNIDVAPTLAELAGVSVPVAIDGQSFAAALTGAALPAPRSDFLLEHFRLIRGDAIGLSRQPVDGDQLQLFFGDPLARPRATVLFELDDDRVVGPGAIQVPIGSTAEISLRNLGATVIVNVPNTRFLYIDSATTLSILDDSPAHDGVYWWVEIDQGGAFLPTGARPNSVVVPPDYVGVRDVARGYTYVEYETNEVELYDLDADPFQLENKAGDPAYAAVQSELAGRLDALLAAPPAAGGAPPAP